MPDLGPREAPGSVIDSAVDIDRTRFRLPSGFRTDRCTDLRLVFKPLSVIAALGFSDSYLKNSEIPSMLNFLDCPLLTTVCYCRD